jgi:hypothetical protein
MGVRFSGMYRYAKWLPTLILLLVLILGSISGGGVELLAVFSIWFVVQSLALVPTAAYAVGKWYGELTSESAETDTVETSAAPESKWWLAHLFVTIGLILLVISFALSFPLGAESDAIFAGIMLSSGMMVFFGFIGMIGYYHDAKALQAADAAWQPNPWVWIVVGFIFGQVFLMPVYLARRWWTVGLDWSKLPVIGHRVSG